MNNRQKGAEGEWEIIRRVPCPNCKKKLMALPPNYPLYDVQCTGCSFRAQVKTVASKPRRILFGAGWEIMHKVLKSGFMVPPLFINFRWQDGQEIRFYPFVPRTHLKHYQLSPKARRANYKMFRYDQMDRLPHFVVYRYGYRRRGRFCEGRGEMICS